MSGAAAPTIEIVPDQGSLRIGGEEQAVGARAFDVLAYLHANSDRMVSKTELLENVWADLTVEECNLTVQIAALRKLLGPRAIATVPGLGYQFTLGPTKSPLKPEALPLPDKPSLAILPFANLTGDIGTDYLIDGIVADLIAALSRISAFLVIAASSTFTLKGQSLDLAEVGRRLGVRYILEGSIQQAGDRLRINTQLVQAWHTTRLQVAKLDRQLVVEARQSEACRLLTLIPGVGAITATSFVTAIEDPDNFRRSRSVGAWLGLTTRRYQSGEVDYDGHISRRGDRHLRALLYEAATVILTRSRGDSDLRTWGLKLKERIGFKRAVAVARKLAVTMHAMLRDNTPFTRTAKAAA